MQRSHFFKLVRSRRAPHCSIFVRAISPRRAQLAHVVAVRPFASDFSIKVIFNHEAFQKLAKNARHNTPSSLLYISSTSAGEIPFIASLKVARRLYLIN